MYGETAWAAVNVECYSLARMRRFFATGSSAGIRL